MPVTWKELEKARPLDYTIGNAHALLARRGDIWSDMLEAKQDLVKTLG
jgi:bifunctional non-homologous end joining protein LigD